MPKARTPGHNHNETIMHASLPRAGTKRRLEQMYEDFRGYLFEFALRIPSAKIVGRDGKYPGERRYPGPVGESPIAKS
jgi:hypothetical protein